MSNAPSQVYRSQLAAQFSGDYDAEKYVERAVRNAKSRLVGQSPRWAAVSEIFACGSGYAHELCRRFDLDPDELVLGAQLEVS